MIIASDFDGTLTFGEMGRATGKYLIANGEGAAYKKFMYTQLPIYALSKIGLVNSRFFKKRWTMGMPKLFAGYTAEQIQAVFEWVVEHEMWPKRRQDVIDELKRHLDNGHQVVIVSGGYQPMLEAFARRIGGASALGTPFEMVGGKATGKLAAPLNVGEEKVHTLQKMLNGQTLDMAYGDTLDDLPMLMMSQTPVAAHPNPRLTRLAQEKGWRILA